MRILIVRQEDPDATNIYKLVPKFICEMCGETIEHPSAGMAKFAMSSPEIGATGEVIIVHKGNCDRATAEASGPRDTWYELTQLTDYVKEDEREWEEQNDLA